MAPVETLAHTVSSILNEDFFVVPDWGGHAQLGAWLLISLYLIALFPHLRAGVALGITASLLIALLTTHFVLMTREALWVSLMMPAALLMIGHALLTTKRFLVTERGKLASDAESADSNRMLGLAFQGQGQLDMPGSSACPRPGLASPWWRSPTVGAMPWARPGSPLAHCPVATSRSTKRTV